MPETADGNDYYLFFVDKYLSGRILEEIKEDLKKKNLTYDEFENEKNGIPISLELTPGNGFGMQESLARHLDSNLEQIYIGGSTVRVFPTKDKCNVRVVVTNETGKNSLFLHVATDVKREKNHAENEILSNITQILIFNISIDENTFK